MKSVGAYEAKTHFPKLLGRVAKGESIEITRHGVAVAKLVPVNRASSEDIAAIISKWRDSRRGIRLNGLSIKQMKEEGRRY